MTMAARVFVDTNILVYATLEEVDESLHKECMAQLDRFIEDGTELLINGQVIREYWAQATFIRSRGEQRSLAWVLERVAWFRDIMREVDETAAVREQLLTLLESHAIRRQDVHDANIVATMLAHSVDTLFARDGDFDRYRERITIITPQVSPT